MGASGLAVQAGGGPRGDAPLHTLEPLAWHWSHWPGRLVNRGGECLHRCWEGWVRLVRLRASLLLQVTGLTSVGREEVAVALVLEERALGQIQHLPEIRFKDNHFTEMCSGSEAGSYLRLIDSCITQLKAQGPSRTCNESKEEEN